MIVRHRCRAKACLCSVITSLLLGQGGALLAQAGNVPVQTGNVQAPAANRTADDSDSTRVGNGSAASPTSPVSKPGVASKSVAVKTKKSVPNPPAKSCPYTPNRLPGTEAAKPMPPRQRLPLLTSGRTAAIQQVAGTMPGSGSPPANPGYAGSATGGSSDVQQELQKLYQRDGRAMPPMNMSQLTVPSNPPPAATRETPDEGAAPAHKSFFQRTFPGLGRWFHRSAPEPTVQRSPSAYPNPNQLPPPGMRPQQPPFVHPRQPNMANSPRPGLFPGVQQPAPVGAPPMQIRPAQPNVAVAPSAAPHVATETPRLAAPGAGPLAAPAADAPLAAPPQLAAPEVAAEVKDSPFSGRKLFPEDAEEPKLAAAKPSSIHDDVDDDLKLDDDSPAEHAPQVAATESSRNDQLKLLAERSGLNGFKGFCPVTLKNERKLVTAKPEYVSEYNSRVYTFASAEAKLEFDLAPDHYVPVQNGRDVVQLAGGTTAAEGSLDHAAWFKGRLYLFASEDSMDTFVSAPAKYAAAAATK